MWETVAGNDKVLEEKGGALNGNHRFSSASLPERREGVNMLRGRCIRTETAMHKKRPTEKEHNQIMKIRYDNGVQLVSLSSSFITSAQYTM